MTRADRLLTVKEVARMLHVSVATVWRYSKNGALPEPIKIGGHTRWIKAEILAVIESKKAKRSNPASCGKSTPTSNKRNRVRLEVA